MYIADFTSDCQWFFAKFAILLVRIKFRDGGRRDSLIETVSNNMPKIQKLFTSFFNTSSLFHQKELSCFHREKSNRVFSTLTSPPFHVIVCILKLTASLKSDYCPQGFCPTGCVLLPSLARLVGTTLFFVVAVSLYILLQRKRRISVNTTPIFHFHAQQWCLNIATLVSCGH